MALVHNKIKRQYTRMMRQLVKDFSRGPTQVVLSLPDLQVDCPNCGYNRMDQQSNRIYNTSFVTPITVFSGTPAERVITPASFNRGRCPVCFGNGKLVSPVTHTIQCHTYWGPNLPAEDGDFSDIPAGRKPDNYVMLKTPADNYSLVYKALSAYVDGVYVEPLRPPIVRGLAGATTLCVAWYEAVKSEKTSTRY